MRKLLFNFPFIHIEIQEFQGVTTCQRMWDQISINDDKMDI
jgi:hypothetical protein